jgi:hypothetical protein
MSAQGLEWDEQIGHGIDWVRGRELYPRLLRDDNTLHFRERTRSRAEIRDWLNDLGGKIRTIKTAFETGEFAAVPSPRACRRCPAPGLCPLPEELRGFHGISGPEEARAVAEAWEVTNDRQKAVQAALKGYVGEHGDLPYGDGLVLTLEPDSRNAMRLKRKEIADAVDES